MLHFPEARIIESSPEQASGQSDGALSVFSFDKLVAAVRRQMWPIVGGAVIGLLLGIAYVMTAVPIYTASTDILVDKNKSRTLNELSDAPTNVVEDEATMLSQVELLRSQNMAAAVNSKLKLSSNERFMAGTPSLLGQAIGTIASLPKLLPSLGGEDEIKPVDQQARDAKAVAMLVGNTSVNRVGRTYVLKLSYRSPDPVLAQQIAETFASAYLDDQLEAKYDATRRASDWLQIRIAELKTQSFQADLAVQKFRSDNNLISANGQLVSEQQLTEINTQLITAQAATAEAKARFDQIEGLIKSGRTDAVVNDALVSSTINSLREKYLDSSRRQTEIANKLGPNHIQAIRLRSEMTEYERLIFGELSRIAESYRNAYNVASSRQKSLEDNLSSAVGVSANNNQTQVQLRELEREAETFKTLYENFLQRYQETIQQQSFPVTEARVISKADVPNSPSAPKKPMMLVLFLFMGTAVGVGVAGMREHRERFFRVGDQVRSELGQEFLGYVPLLAGNRARSKEAEAFDVVGAGIWSPESKNAYVRSHPLSSFAEALRNVKVAADLSLPDHRSKVIGVVSSLPSEGKSTTASNFALLLAMHGARTLLIDGDLRNPGTTRALARKPDNGVIEAIIEGGSIDKYLQWDQSGRLAVLPTLLKHRISHSSEVLTSAAMSSLLAEAKTKFDYILIDLPPLGPIIDAKAFASRLDAFVFVVEWGRTSRHMVASVLANHPGIRNKSLGVLLSKADESKMRYYRSYGSSEYYSSRYAGYYHN